MTTLIALGKHLLIQIPQVPFLASRHLLLLIIGLPVLFRILMTFFSPFITKGQYLRQAYPQRSGLHLSKLRLIILMLNHSTGLNIILHIYISRIAVYVDINAVYSQFYNY